jgi:hypothetical protein
MPDIQYIAGSCNIGKGEIRRRQLVAVVGLFFSISTLLTFNTVDAPTSIRLGILPQMIIGNRRQLNAINPSYILIQ